MKDPEQVYSSTPPPVQDSVEAESYQNVVILNDGNFTGHILSSKPTLVMFYAPCKYLYPNSNYTFIFLTCNSLQFFLAYLTFVLTIIDVVDATI